MLQWFEEEQTGGRSGAANSPKIAKIHTWGVVAERVERYTSGRRGKL
jgi:hypothetical protein